MLDALHQSLALQDDEDEEPCDQRRFELEEGFDENDL